MKCQEYEEKFHLQHFTSPSQNDLNSGPSLQTILEKYHFLSLQAVQLCTVVLLMKPCSFATGFSFSSSFTTYFCPEGAAV